MKTPGRYMSESIDPQGYTNVGLFAFIYNLCFLVILISLAMMSIGLVIS